ncbi:MAG: hypothetical protein ACP5NZ_00285 [Nanobdellota archaeon]
MLVKEENNYCLCIVLSDIFSRYGLGFTKEFIGDHLTPTSKGFRADDDKIKDFLKKEGLDYNFYWWNQTPLNEPDSLLKEISKNEGFVGIGNHALRVISFNDPEIIIIDPDNVIKAPEKMDYYSLLDKMRKSDGGFGLIKRL